MTQAGQKELSFRSEDLKDKTSIQCDHDRKKRICFLSCGRISGT
jgi:hypothetical protein